MKMIVFRKYAYEEVYRAYEFARDDDLDGLASGETISSHVVTCAEKVAGTDRTATMISNTSVVSGTQVSYLLKGGTAGTEYVITVTAVTTLGQKHKGVVDISIM
jgi:hypothetical protein